MLRDAGGTDIRWTVLPEGFSNGSVVIELGGDCECETFADALIWAGTRLKECLSRGVKRQ
jgi:hypothetical protein